MLIRSGWKTEKREMATFFKTLVSLSHQDRIVKYFEILLRKVTTIVQTSVYYYMQLLHSMYSWNKGESIGLSLCRELQRNIGCRLSRLYKTIVQNMTQIICSI